MLLWFDKLNNMYPDVEIIEDSHMPIEQKGLYMGNVIFLNKCQTEIEKGCTLAEEFGHHETTYGNISCLDDCTSCKLELIARRWGYRKILPIEKIQDALNQNFEYLYEFADYLNVTEQYLKSALEYYTLVNALSVNMNIDSFI